MDVFPLIAPVNVLGFTVYPFLTSKHHIAKQDKPKNENNMWFPYTVWDEPRYPYLEPKLRTAISVILQGNIFAGWLCHFGLKCASWTGINSGTSQRCPCAPIGCLDHPSVREGNGLASRTLVLFCCMDLQTPVQILENILYP